MLVIVRRLELRRWQVAERLEQSAIVEPIDPRERCELDSFAAAPRPVPVDHLGLEEAVDGLGVTVRSGASREWGPASDRRIRRRSECGRGGSMSEKAVSVGGGRVRFPDLVVQNADGKTVAINVGRATQAGQPVAREARALGDLRNSGEFDHVFFLEY